MPLVTVINNIVSFNKQFLTVIVFHCIRVSQFRHLIRFRTISEKIERNYVVRLVVTSANERKH